MVISALLGCAMLAACVSDNEDPPAHGVLKLTECQWDEPGGTQEGADYCWEIEGEFFGAQSAMKAAVADVQVVIRESGSSVLIPLNPECNPLPERDSDIDSSALVCVVTIYGDDGKALAMLDVTKEITPEYLDDLRAGIPSEGYVAVYKESQWGT
jgi:hypothetical protein